jgi:hypothetical protein
MSEHHVLIPEQVFTELMPVAEQENKKPASWSMRRCDSIYTRVLDADCDSRQGVET